MKKKITAILVLAVMLVSVLAGCNTKYEEISAISKSSKLWLSDVPQNSSDMCGYAVTDLDQNGRPELIAAVNGGKENYTSFKIFEVNEDKSGITECEYEGISEELSADIMSDKVDCYKDKTTNTYYYVFTDSLTKSIRETYETKVVISLVKGKLTQKAIAVKATVYEGDSETPTVSYTNANGVAITESEYKSIARSYFAEYERISAEIGWKGYNKSNYTAITSLDQTGMTKLLSDSYGKFKLG